MRSIKVYLGDTKALARAFITLVEGAGLELVPLSADERFPNLKPTCHDGSSYLEVKDDCGTALHVHESELPLPSCPGCGYQFAAHFLRRDFDELRRLAHLT